MDAKTCPKCNSEQVFPIVYGLPDGDTFDAEGRGKVVLGGCVVTNHDPRWQCRACGHRWGRAARGNFEGAAITRLLD